MAPGRSDVVVGPLMLGAVPAGTLMGLVTAVDVGPLSVDTPGKRVKAEDEDIALVDLSCGGSEAVTCASDSIVDVPVLLGGVYVLTGAPGRVTELCTTFTGVGELLRIVGVVAGPSSPRVDESS